MNPSVPKYLNDLPLLRNLSEAEVEQISQCCARRLLTRETVVQPAGEPARFLGFVLSGRGRELLPLADGRVSVLRPLRGGSQFNEQTLVEDEPSPVLVTCSAGSELLLVSASAVKALLPESPRLSAALARALHLRAAALCRRIAVLLTPRAEDRVRAYLTLLAREQPASANPAGRRSELTHEQIGIDCNLSRETVTRVLGAGVNRDRRTDGPDAR